jgi:non-canonical (house-cleaning) NTP pyrophosphatase
VKIAAVQGALIKSFPGIEFDVFGKSVSSGVADQPMTDIETRQVFVLMNRAISF